MKESIAIAMVGVGICTAAPAFAGRTVVVDQVIDLNRSMFRADGSDIYLGTAPPTLMESGDVIEGTVLFRGGHIQNFGSKDLWVFSWKMAVERVGLETSSWAMSFVDDKGGFFGTKKITGGYPDGYSVSVTAAGPADVYGLRYRIAFVRGQQGWNFAFNPIAINARYAEGDIFTSAVPEPSSWAMMAMGFAGLALAMRRRRAAGATVHA